MRQVIDRDTPAIDDPRTLVPPQSSGGRIDRTNGQGGQIAEEPQPAGAVLA